MTSHTLRSRQRSLPAAPQCGGCSLTLGGATRALRARSGLSANPQRVALRLFAQRASELVGSERALAT